MAVVLAIMLMVGAAGCLPPHEGNMAGPRVTLLGDSIMQQVGDRLDARVRVWSQSARSSVIGARADQMVADAVEGGGRTDIAVIELGQNDALQIARGEWNIEQTYSAFTQLRDTFAAARCIVYVTTNQHTTGFWSDYWADKINTWWLYQWLADPGRYRFADWNGYVDTHRDATFDGVHPWGNNSVHEQALIDLIDNAARSCP